MVVVVAGLLEELLELLSLLDTILESIAELELLELESSLEEVDPRLTIELELEVLEELEELEIITLELLELVLEELLSEDDTSLELVLPIELEELVLLELL